MRKVLLAAVALGTMIVSAGPAGAGCLGRCGGPWAFPPAVSYFPPAYYAPPVYYYPYPYSYSYFRPEGPYGYNRDRNWRDTWQDDGVKVHAYTLR